MMNSCLWESEIVESHSKWLAENINEMDCRVKQLLKLIEADGSYPNNKLDGYSEKKPVSIAHIGEFCRMYKSLAESYGHLSGAIKSCGLLVDETKDSPLLTPYQTPYQKMQVQTPYLTPSEKLGFQKSSQQTVEFDVTPSSGGGSSDVSLKEVTDSSSSSDSEFELLNPFDNINENTSDQAAEEDAGNSVKTGTDTYEQILGKLSAYQEELRDSRVKLTLSENEVTRLRSELEKNGILASNLHAQLEQSQEEIKAREHDIETEKINMLEMQNHISELETIKLQSEKIIEKLTKELEVTAERLKASDEETVKLKIDVRKQLDVAAHDLLHEKRRAQEERIVLESKLDSERMLVMDLQERNSELKIAMSECESEVQELKDALSDSNGNFSLEKMKLHSELDNLLGKSMQLAERFEELKLHAKSLEDKIAQVEIEKLEMQKLHGVKELEVKRKINSLKADIAERDENFNKIKLRCDMLEKAIERERGLVTDIADEKMEAINQLCFTIEHYRGKYQELLHQALSEKAEPTCGFIKLIMH